jgi:D-alanyl-D-alanine carboxypeptidase
MVLALSMLAVPLTAGAQPGATCESFSETEQEICGLFLTYWEHNGGLPVFGLPLTPQFSELSADTLMQHDVQYYERERFEHHPENEGTPYTILLGRLGVDMLAARGVDWMTLPKASPSDAHYMATTGQAIAPVFWEYWSSRGLDLGDAGVSFRESLALFGYPVSPAQVETNADGDTVLTQWFERARFERHGDNVLLGRLGAEVTASDGDLSIRVRTELDAALRMSFATTYAEGVIATVAVDELGAWTGALGVANPQTGAPYAGDTRHRIGSVTKTFVATLALLLVDEGLLSLDETIDAWFPETPYSDRITIRMLLNMTSGMADYATAPDFLDDFFGDPERTFEPEELLAYAADLPPMFEPGADWHYCNGNYVMLGLIIEAVTGQDVRAALQDRILDPLGLDGTTFPSTSDNTLPEPFARGTSELWLPLAARHRLPEQGPPRTTAQTDGALDSTNWSPSIAFTAGAMISTIDDLRVWSKALATGALLSDEMRREQQSWVERYGLGMFELNGWIGHNGSIPGYFTFMLYHPELNASYVLLLNTNIPNADGTSPLGALTTALLPIASRTAPPLYD